MTSAYICDAVRTAVGKYAGGLSAIRTDDLAAIPMKALMERNSQVDWKKLDDVYYGCVNQAGEDNRNVARMALLLAGLPPTTGGVTFNRLCASSLDAIGTAARAIKSGELDLIIAGGVESMSRAPYVINKSAKPFGRDMKAEDTTIGWRFINRKMEEQYGVDSMPGTAENVAEDYNISREDQDAFALRSQQRAHKAIQNGAFKDEIVPVVIPQRKGDPVIFDTDEHPRDTSAEALAKLKGVVKQGGTVTAGNASGINDGAAAVLIASEDAVKEHNLKPRAKILSMAIAGVEPRVMGVGPIEAVNKALKLAGLTIEQMDVIELNEAFAAQSLACMRAWGLKDDAENVNPNGGAIALGHPLGASGARLVTTALYELERRGGKYALCTMCVGVGQGVAVVIERVENA